MIIGSQYIPQATNRETYSLGFIHHGNSALFVDCTYLFTQIMMEKLLYSQKSKSNLTIGSVGACQGLQRLDKVGKGLSILDQGQKGSKRAHFYKVILVFPYNVAGVV